jgi:hypothetical protein
MVITWSAQSDGTVNWGLQGSKLRELSDDTKESRGVGSTVSIGDQYLGKADCNRYRTDFDMAK